MQPEPPPPPPPPPSPYTPPQEDDHAPAVVDETVRKKVNLAAILIIVNAVIGLLFLLIPTQSEDQFYKMLHDMESLGFDTGGMDPELMVKMMTISATATKIIKLLSLSLVIFFAIKMRNFQSWGMSVAASVLTIIPCTSSCCLIGIPVGIYAMMVLYNPQVKAAFKARTT